MYFLAYSILSKSLVSSERWDPHTNALLNCNMFVLLPQFYIDEWWAIMNCPLRPTGKVWLIEPTHYILIEHVICYRPKLIWLLLPSDFPMRCLVYKDLKVYELEWRSQCAYFLSRKLFHRGRATMCKDPSVKQTGVKKIASAFRVPYKQWGCRGNSKHKTRLELQLN